MAMGVGGSKDGPRSDINITPLVDVVLVLLIIFMVITPLAQMGHETRLPPKVENLVQMPNQDQIIVRMDREKRIYINKDLIPENDFPFKLQEVMQGRANKVAFFAADGELDYGTVSRFLDVCRKNGADNIGIVFDDIQ